MAISTYIYIITSNVNGLNAQSKDTGWLHGYRNKSCVHAAYRSHFRAKEQHTETESEGSGQKVFYASGYQNSWVQYSLLD